MSQVSLPLKPQRRWGETKRRDLWWVQPTLVVVVLGGFLAYSTFRMFEGTHYYFDGVDDRGRSADYLSPFYSPLIFDSPAEVSRLGKPSGHAWLSSKPAWLPTFVTGAMLILIVPAGFRFTCYYYRGAYYKAFWADPPACAVGEPRKSYLGEQYFPLIAQNIHRYFLYFAIAFLFILSYDAWRSMWFRDVEGQAHFGIGLGTLILTANVVFLSLYTLGCHSFRHLIGGRRDELSKSGTFGAYRCVTCLNQRHMLWAWISLFGVAFADIYVRMCAAGVWTDWRLL